jgi:hypothetical protein
MFFYLSSQNLSLQDQEDVSNLVEQLSSKDWQERMQAIDTMAEMIETRLPLFTSNIVKVKTLISFVFLSISICHFQSKLLFALRPISTFSIFALKPISTQKEKFVNCDRQKVPSEKISKLKIFNFKHDIFLSVEIFLE